MFIITASTHTLLPPYIKCEKECGSMSMCMGACVCLCTLSPHTAAQHCIYDSFTDTTRRVEREKGGSEGDRCREGERKRHGKEKTKKWGNEVENACVCECERKRLRMMNTAKMTAAVVKKRSEQKWN